MASPSNKKPSTAAWKLQLSTVMLVGGILYTVAVHVSQFPRGSIDTTIMEIGPKRPSPLWFWEPNSIIVVYMDPLGSYTNLVTHPQSSGLNSTVKMLEDFGFALWHHAAAQHIPVARLQHVRFPARGV